MEHSTALAMVKRQCKKQFTIKNPRPTSIDDGKLWHIKMKHPGSMNLYMLNKNALGVKLQDFKTIQCLHCNMAKIKCQIF